MKIYVFKLSRAYLAIGIILAIILAALIIPRFIGKSVETIATLSPITRGTTQQKIMAFTCNVDWGNEYIPTILDVLDKEDIKITFFITGRWANNYPEILKEIADRGHEIANHGYGHKNHKVISLELNKEEILKTEQAINKTTDKMVKYFAPPSGSWGENTIKATKGLGYKTILWTIDTIDWRDKNPDIILKRVTENPVEGGIVLMHPTEGTTRALESIINTLRKKGYKIGTVSDVLK